MAKSGLKHIDVGAELTKTEWESEESHELLHGTSFPGSPVERQLFYRDDEHKWYIYNASEWVWLGGGSGGGMVEHGNEYHNPDFAEASHTHAQLHTQLCEAADFTKLDGIEAGADVTASHAPQAHKTSHQDGGADEMSVASLSGELADLQKPKDHTHQSAGSGVGGKLDHGLALNGLSDDDHPQYIKHSLATAVSDFLVASGAGAFVKKTLAEVKTLLNWAADIATHAGLTTGVHGVGAGTIAKVADIATDGNLSSAAQDAITKKHTQNTDKIIKDADADTAWEVEQSADEDKIRGKVAGVEAFHIDTAGVLTLAKQSAARAYLSANQDIPTATWTKINLNAEAFDIQNEFDIATNRRFTAKTGGIYLAVGVALMYQLNDGTGVFVAIYKNGSEVTESRVWVSKANESASGMSFGLFPLVANDYLELWVFHTNGSTRAAYGEERYTSLSVCKVA